MKSIGFIGLGTMGLPMATNLLGKGYPLTVYNRTAAKAAELVEKGAELAASPAAVARSVDVLFTNVSDDRALQELFYGSKGIMEGVHPGLTVIDCSTVAPETSRGLYEELGAHLVDFLDAPVTGSKMGAAAATLFFMVGGREEVFEEQRELLSALGTNALYFGPSGSGSYAKLAHNTIVGINAAGFIEGMALAAKAGLDPEKFVQVVVAGGAGSKQAELKGPKIIGRDFSVQFALQLMLKDLLLASRETSRFQLPSPMLHSASSLFQMGLSKGFGAEDLSALVKVYEEWLHLTVQKHPNETPSDVPMQLSMPLPAAASASERRRANRVSVGIKLQLSVYQWEQEGAFTGQTIEGVLYDLSESGLQIISTFPLAKDMFVVIHFPQEADLPPITGKIVRIEAKEGKFRYGCMLSGIAPYIRLKLEAYIADREKEVEFP
ncbi:MAG: NAD-binding protein [Paenibacillaceae bacterium]|nr:NAD-binding protein [Paenibacillaceae bacterium]